MKTGPDPRPTIAAVVSCAVVSALLAWGCSSTPISAEPDAGQGGADADADAEVAVADAGPCVPGAASLVCTDSTTVSACTEDTDFDGNSDGPPTTVEIGCAAFFGDVGSASCEAFDGTTTEALCTMDDGGPCGVVLISGQFASVRCTSDSAVCLLDLEVANYVCTTGTGIVCDGTGDQFVPFCKDDLLVWRCSDDGDGIGQPHVDDCGALGNGTCDAIANKCVDIEQGGTCNLTEWLCGAGLKCEDQVCVPL